MTVEKLNELVIALIAAAITSLFSALISAIFSALLINGAIFYGISESGDARFISFYVTNHQTTPIDVRIGLSGEDISINSTNGLASPKIEKNEGRKGSIITISDIPPKSAYALIIKERLNDIPVKISNLSPTNNLELSNLDVRRSPIDWVSLSIQTAINSVILFMLFAISENRRRTISSEFREAKSDLKKKLETTELKIERNMSIMTKTRILYGKNLRMVIKENEFWRGIFQKIIVSAGLGKDTAKTLLSVVSDKLGTRSESNIDEVEISTLIDLILDPEQSKRLDQFILK